MKIIYLRAFINVILGTLLANAVTMLGWCCYSTSPQKLQATGIINLPKGFRCHQSWVYTTDLFVKNKVAFALLSPNSWRALSLILSDNVAYKWKPSIFLVVSIFLKRCCFCCGDDSSYVILMFYGLIPSVQNKLRSTQYAASWVMYMVFVKNGQELRRFTI